MYFDDVALNWDTNARIQRAKILSEKISEELNNTANLYALDFGCGTGLLSFCLSDSFRGIACSDLSDKMLEVLSNKLASSDYPNIKTIPLKELYSSECNNKFDVIYSSMVFHHIVDVKAELKKLYGLLKENGSLIIIDLDIVDERFHSDCPDFDGHHGFDRQDILDIFEQCGLTNINFKTVYSGQKVIKNSNINYSLFLIKGKK